MVAEREVVVTWRQLHFIAAGQVVNRNGDALRLGMSGLDCGEHVRGERGDTAFSWQMIGDKRNLADSIRIFFQETLSAGTIDKL